MEVNNPTLRGRSQNISHNQQRSLSTESTELGISKASSMDYTNRMQIQNHQSWTEQLEDKKQNTLQINMPQCHNEANSPLSPYANNSNHSVSPLDLEPSAIPYQANQPTDPELWDRNFNSISLFGTDEFLASSAKNIACSLQRIATFIK